jgi:Flp pilus assembly protein TadG
MNGKRSNRTQRGQGLVELALALPALLIIFLGLIEMGFLLRAHLVVVNANREAARFASRGTFTDEQIVDRALTSFAYQLPVVTEGADANTQVIVTRFFISSQQSVPGAYNTPYVEGELGEASQIDLDATVARLKQENDDFNNDLMAAQPDAVRTAQDVVFVEIFYHHYEVMGAPIVEWVFPDPMVVYSRTVMRVGESRAY